MEHKKGKIGVWGLLVIGFFWVHGGIYGNEAMLMAAPPAYVFVMLGIVPFYAYTRTSLAPGVRVYVQYGRRAPPPRARRRWGCVDTYTHVASVLYAWATRTSLLRAVCGTRGTGQPDPG